MHLHPEELVDLADGTRDERDVLHLRACEACRTELARMRATLALAADVSVPEPSPLFWDHLSARVVETVERVRDGERPVSWRQTWSGRRVWIPVSAAAVVALILTLTMTTRLERPDVHTPIETARTIVAPTSPTLSVELLSESVAGDDESLMMVADLTSAIGLDAAADAGMTPEGSAEHAVTHLTATELQELRRLLQLELARRGV